MEQLSFKRRLFLRTMVSLGFGVRAGVVLAAEPIAIVMGGNSSQHAISTDKLRRVFLAIPTNDDGGHRFVPINPGQGSGVRERFDRKVLGMSPDEVARYWVDQRLRGSKPPRSASSYDLLRRVLQELPGSISFMPLSAVGSLRVIAIDGSAPGDLGYALR